ncbi:alcohol dehydrogenase 1-like [Dendrobium catenatum]|uniref:alcohol dehydrogenase 1-like n=1 Tax=Dendrobium catenatum TaxID=906689 RepID=UPI00109F54F1|nr:alcohol dehydrogenase 1-like [Dendrobium catenatum]
MQLSHQDEEIEDLLQELSRLKLRLSRIERRENLSSLGRDFNGVRGKYAATTDSRSLIPTKSLRTFDNGEGISDDQISSTHKDVFERTPPSLRRTNLYCWEAKHHTPLFPRIFGHKAKEIVECIGEGVNELKEGDNVLPIFIGESKEGVHCKSEKNNMCDLLWIDTDRSIMLSDRRSRFTVKGTSIHHFLGTSTFSEYTAVHDGCFGKLDPSTPLDKVCIPGCSIFIGLGATLNIAKPKIRSIVTIFGINEFLNSKDYDKPITYAYTTIEKLKIGFQVVIPLPRSSWVLCELRVLAARMFLSVAVSPPPPASF